MKIMQLAVPIIHHKINVLQDHLPKCEHREVQCSQCGQNMQNHKLKAHQDSECPERLPDGDRDTSHNQDLVVHT